MKKLIFSYLAFLLFSINGNAQTSKGEPWPYGCRTHTFSVEIGPFSYSTETTLCCVAALWKSPPIKCWEMSKSISGNNIYYQYVMISELEKNLNIKISEKSINFTSKYNLIEDNSVYQLIEKNYTIEINELNEKFIKLEFTKIE